MNARFMCESVRADNRLIGLDNDACVIADELADAGDLCGINVRVQSENRMTSFERHDHLFERCISRAFTNPVDGHFRLLCARTNASQSIGCCHSEIVVAMNRDGDPFMHSGRMLDNAIDEIKNSSGVV